MQNRIVLFKGFGEIRVGTTEKELLEAEPSFVYDEFEEVWESEKGVFIEMDAETNTVRWISEYLHKQCGPRGFRTLQGCTSHNGG